MLDDSVAVGRVGKPQVQDLRVGHRLLQSVAGQLVVSLRFDDRDWKVRLVGEKVVGLLARTAAMFPTHRNDPTVREVLLLADLVVGPACFVEPWQDIPTASIGFVGQAPKF
ncbi:MAG TPA: hypothetical protein VGK08_05770 [Thermoanaerobaculia bacterium]